MSSVVELGERAKAASRLLATASTNSKNAALLTAADLLLERAAEIQAANDADLAAAHRLAPQRHGERAAHGRGAGRPGGRGARRLEAAERPADHAHPGAARGDRDHLREPTQ